MKVAIVGATGATGGSIVNGLLESEHHFEITALTRPSSIEKTAVVDLKDRGVKIVPFDLHGDEDDFVRALQGIDVVISAIHYQSLADEIPLSSAAKTAGVKRYVPCFFATAAPRGVMQLRDVKEGILDHIQQIHLPYTVIDVGWWYQITLPGVPSGALDYALAFANNTIIGGGEVPSALVDLNDIGKYVAAIISDPRTINKKVFASTETKSQNQVFDLVRKLTGEKPDRRDLSRSDLETKIDKCKGGPGGVNQMRATYEYWYSWGIRGDNTEEYAGYLGYLIASDLYPSLKGRSLEQFVKDIIEGSEEKVYS